MGTRAVEIAAAGLFFLTTLYLIIENIVSDFQGRILIARLGAGLLSILGGWYTHTQPLSHTQTHAHIHRFLSLSHTHTCESVCYCLIISNSTVYS